MSIMIENKSLDELAREYFSNPVEKQESVDLNIKRAKQLPTLRILTQQFIQKKSGLTNFLDQLQSVLTRNDYLWGTKGPGFMMELNKLRKNHDEHDPIAENELRIVLTGINQDNLGERIEQFYTFLLRERGRLHQESKTSNQAMAPGNAAFMLSLFAFWLNSERPPVIYYPRTYQGIAYLISSGLLPDPGDLKLVYDASSKAKTLTVHNNREHLAFQRAIQSLMRSSEALQNAPTAIELFLSWLVGQLKSKSEPPLTIFKEIDNTDVLANPPTEQVTVHEAPEAYTLTGPLEKASESMQETTTIIAPEPLRPTLEPLLMRLIREVQRHILIDEETILRIYHALLAGHVILTGPPGTGKTELARLIPEILWKSELKRTEPTTSTDEPEEPELTTQTAYTTRLITATDEWSVRTLISGIAPQSKDGAVSYKVQYGYLTSTILKNWSFQGNQPEEWSTLTLRRTTITAQSGIERGSLQTFRGQWLVIDEFNRAPIDLALGDALTALGGNDVLRVSIEGGSAELPIPQDFRIIGTLNSFDRSYLNQISEALKRRFSFIEILPPSRAQREAEQSIVLFKALNRISHLSATIDVSDNSIYWGNIAVEPTDNGHYTITWPEEQTPFRSAFEAAWHLFEVIRIYRQLGTAQAITLMQHILIPGILQHYTTEAEWIKKAVDVALCDTIADQLQVLLPDEIDTLLLYLTTEHSDFSKSYHALLAHISDNQHRLYGQLLALGSVSNENGHPILTDEHVEQIAKLEQPVVPEGLLNTLFHLDKPLHTLPQFTRRLRTFKAERGL